MRAFLSFLLVAGLAACANQGGASSEPPPSVAASLASEEATPTEEPTPTADASAGSSIDADATISGMLSADDIEGGCMFVAADDGMAYEVIWPDGWSVSPSFELIDPSGQVVAAPGDHVTVHGRVATDMASICQMGQIFEAVEVELH
jgi:hypothetical protein